MKRALSNSALIPTDPHPLPPYQNFFPQKIMPHPPPPTQSNAPFMPTQPPPTQNNAPPTQNNSHSLKIMP